MHYVIASVVSLPRNNIATQSQQERGNAVRAFMNDDKQIGPKGQCFEGFRSSAFFSCCLFPRVAD
jgi:hypothetical protein